MNSKPDSFLKRLVGFFETEDVAEDTPRSDSRDFSKAPSSDSMESPAPRRLPAPQSEAEILDFLKRAPESALSKRQRRLIISAMSFSDTKVEEVMLERPAVTFVQDTEVLGPVVLDKLYKTGFTRFPVIDGTGRIVGTLSIDNLTSLAIKNPDRAFKYLDPSVFYVRSDYSLEMAFATFLRTGAYLLIVINKKK